uniref:Uncharacterized protein n=1 Tax=Timema shepardi TaxID=629360 RepID=A0A7R9FY88_TIMSH|nr:unnamed protein product [Timema shepardi]
MLSVFDTCGIVLPKTIPTSPGRVPPWKPGDENELREGFGGHMTRLHMIKRRNRTVSESYSMDVRQRPNAQQLQKRVRRFSGGSGIGTQKRADLPGFVGSGHIRTHSFGSERQRTYSASESHNRGKSYHKEVKADGSHSKARVNFDLRNNKDSASEPSRATSTNKILESKAIDNLGRINIPLDDIQHHKQMCAQKGRGESNKTR